VKIVVLNESFLSPDHLRELEKLGELKVYTDTNGQSQAIERLAGADIAIGDCFFAPFDAEFFLALPRLKLLCINSTGFDSVDLRSASQNGTSVANVPNFSTEAVAEHTFALLLALIRSIPPLDAQMRKNIFEIVPADPEVSDYCGFELQGKTLGIIGLGAIGRRVSEIGHAFGMKVIAYNRSPTEGHAAQVSLEDLLRSSDVVSLHSALAPNLENLINAEKIALMKPTAVLINTARGKMVSTEALYAALKEKQIKGAGLDVIGPGEHAQALAALSNVIVTPHSAFYTQEATQTMADIISLNVKNFVAGKPQNIVNEKTVESSNE